MTAHRAWRRIRAEARCSFQAAWRALVCMLNGDDLTHAAAIAFYALLSLFPFLLLVSAMLGSVTADEADRASVLGFVLRYFPARLDFVATQLDAIRGNRAGVGAAGILGLLWGSFGVFGAITGAVNQAWGVETRRGFWKHRLVSFLFLAASGAVTLGALLLLTARRVVQASWFGALLDRFDQLAILQAFEVEYFATVLLIVGLGLVFYFVPNARIRFRDVWVGAVVTGALWRVAFAGFSWFTARNAQLQLLNGSLAVAVAFLLWAYVSAIILLYGAQFTAAHARVRRGRLDSVPAAPVLP
jgi:membrane protein